MEELTSKAPEQQVGLFAKRYACHPHCCDASRKLLHTLYMALVWQDPEAYQPNRTNKRACHLCHSHLHVLAASEADITHDVFSHCSVMCMCMLCAAILCGDLLFAELRKARGTQLPIALPLLALAFTISHWVWAAQHLLIRVIPPARGLDPLLMGLRILSSCGHYPQGLQTS